MRKEVLGGIILVLVVCFSSFILADEEEFTLKEGESQEFAGINISIIKIDSEREKARVCVNGKKGIVTEDENNINNAVIKAEDFFDNSLEILVNVPECERAKYCACEDNDCDNSFCFNECDQDSDCNDFNTYTDDKCEGTPKSCVNEKNIDCFENSECDDTNTCTLDICSNDNMCTYVDVENCGTTISIVKESPEEDTEFYAKNINLILVGFVFLLLVLAVIKKKW